MYSSTYINLQLCQKYHAHIQISYFRTILCERDGHYIQRLSIVNDESKKFRIHHGTCLLDRHAHRILHVLLVWQ